MNLLSIILLTITSWAEPVGNCAYRIFSFEQEGKRKFAVLKSEDGDAPGWGDIIDDSIAQKPLFYIHHHKELCELHHRKQGNLVKFDRTKMKLLPPIFQPKNAVAIGLNYQDHNEEVSQTPPKPIVFPKHVEMTGAYDPVIRPAGSLLDWEVELGIVLSQDIKPGYLLAKFKPEDYIAGFVLTNDVSNRAPIIMDNKGGFGPGKNEKTFLPVGPYFVSKDLVKLDNKGLPDLAMSLSVDGEKMQDSRTKYMIHGLGTMLKVILDNWNSQWTLADGTVTTLLDEPLLRAGDLILTGTPGGTALKVPANLWQKITQLLIPGLLQFQGPRTYFVSKEQKSPNYLKPGKVMQTQMEHLGVMMNPISGAKD